jgi:hypothetical protein
MLPHLFRLFSKLAGFLLRESVFAGEAGRAINIPKTKFHAMSLSLKSNILQT